MDMDVPTQHEINTAMAKLKKTKLQEVIAFWQSGAELNKRIHQIISQIWSTEELPDEWDIRVVCYTKRVF